MRTKKIKKPSTQKKSTSGHNRVKQFNVIARRMAKIRTLE
jgi:hypothetical protein